MNTKDNLILALVGALAVYAWVAVDQMSDQPQMIAIPIGLTFGWVLLLANRVSKAVAKSQSERIGGIGKQLKQLAGLEKQMSKTMAGVAKLNKNLPARLSESAARVVRAVEADNAQALVQQKAAISVLQHARLSAPLPVAAGAEGSSALASETLRVIESMESESPVVVCLGSGFIPVLAGAALRERGRGMVVVVESELMRVDSMRREVATQGLEKFVSVVHCPLRHFEFSGRFFSWYGDDWNGALAGDGGVVDLLVVDGPPENTGQDARYPALPQFRSRLAPGAVVLIPRNSDENIEVADRWHTEFALDREDTGILKGEIGVLRKHA